MVYAIDVDHGYDHEDEHFAEEVAAEIGGIDEEVDDALHGIGGCGLAWVDSCADEDDWFFESFWSAALGEEPLVE